MKKFINLFVFFTSISPLFAMQEEIANFPQFFPHRLSQSNLAHRIDEEGEPSLPTSSLIAIRTKKLRQNIFTLKGYKARQTLGKKIASQNRDGVLREFFKAFTSKVEQRFEELQKKYLPINFTDDDKENFLIKFLDGPISLYNPSLRQELVEEVRKTLWPFSQDQDLRTFLEANFPVVEETLFKGVLDVKEGAGEEKNNLILIRTMGIFCNAKLNPKTQKVSSEMRKNYKRIKEFACGELQRRLEKWDDNAQRARLQQASLLFRDSPSVEGEPFEIDSFAVSLPDALPEFFVENTLAVSSYPPGVGGASLLSLPQNTALEEDPFYSETCEEEICRELIEKGFCNEKGEREQASTDFEESLAELLSQPWANNIIALSSSFLYEDESSLFPFLQEGTSGEEVFDMDLFENEG